MKAHGVVGTVYTYSFSAGSIPILIVIVDIIVKVGISST